MPSIQSNNLFDAIVLNSVHKKWKYYFLNGGLKNAYELFRASFINAKIDVNILTPRLSQIMASFSMDPDSIRCIIIDQEPYRFNGVSTGHAFTCNSKISAKLPQLQAPISAICARTQCTDPYLKSWMAQGVWLLNLKLLCTIDVKSSDDDYAFSSIFTKACLAHFCDNLTKKYNNGATQNARCAIMLWGYIMNKYEELFTIYNSPNALIIAPHLLILHARHPNPYSNKDIPDILKFQNTKNFEEVNNWFMEYNLPLIDWATKPMDYNYPDYILATDGSCSANGKPNVSSGVGFVLLKKIYTGIEKRYPHDANYEDYYKIIHEYSMPGTPNTSEDELTLSSPRAELEAIYQGLKYIYELGISEQWLTFNTIESIQLANHSKNIYVVTDSELSINLINGFYKVNKNKDIYEPIMWLNKHLNPQYNFVHSHAGDVKLTDMPLFTIINEYADKLATAANIKK
jgi:uracil DNA glycosylase/ribonuclease HI